jgi:hypothetical protein
LSATAVSSRSAGTQSAEEVALAVAEALKRDEHLKAEQRFRLRDLLRYKLKTVRAYLLKEAFSATLGLQLPRLGRKVPGWVVHSLLRITHHIGASQAHLPDVILSRFARTRCMGLPRVAIGSCHISWHLFSLSVARIVKYSVNLQRECRMPSKLSAPALDIRVTIPGKILRFCHCCWHNPTQGRFAANPSGPVPRRLSWNNCRTILWLHAIATPPPAGSLSSAISSSRVTRQVDPCTASFRKAFQHDQ